MAERNGFLGTFEFNPYAAGAKIYNAMSSNPTSGPVDKTGYASRDRKLRARRNAILAKMKHQTLALLLAPTIRGFRANG